MSMECTSALDEVDEEVAFFLNRSNPDEEEHNAISGEERNNKTELNIDELLGVGPVTDIYGIVHVLRGSYGTPPLS